jgi:anti-sigma regulatory factor (Ser/Thr protein kinase)
MTREAGDHASPGADIQIQARAVASEVAGLRRAVVAAASACGLSARGQSDVGLAVSEACSNVVMHAYVDSTTLGLMFVETYGSAGEFVVVVSDEGTGMAPRADSPGLGFGLALIARLTQRMEVGSNGFGGARVTMAFAHAG